MSSQLQRVLEWLDAAEVKGERVAEECIDGSSRLGRAAQVQTVISVIAIAVVAIVGILIYDQVFTTTGFDVDKNPENRTVYENTTASVNDGFGSAMELIPTVLIVLVAALVIGVIQRLRG